MTPPAARLFSTAEYQRRGDAVRAWLAGQGLDALLIYANAYGGDNVRWLAGWQPRHDTYLIVPQQGQPTLLTQLFNHVPNAQRQAVIADVRWAGAEAADALSAVLRERGLDQAAIGLAGRLPYQDYLGLTAALPTARLTPAGLGYRALRLVKSQEEIEALRRGAALTDAALAALVDAARVGVSEQALAAAIEAAYTAQGGEHGLHYLSSTPMRAPTAYVPAQTQTARRLAPGDVVICELSAGVGGYNGQIHRAIAVGEPPTPAYARLHAVALDAYHGIVAALRPGATVGDVLDAADLIAAEGLSVCDDLLHGYGMGYLPPVVRTRATAHAEQPPERFQFEANMAVVVQPNVYDPATGAGVQVGGLLVITPGGAEALQTYPLEFVGRGP